MAKPILLANRFDRMVRDEPRNNMPPGACWNLVTGYRASSTPRSRSGAASPTSRKP